MDLQRLDRLVFLLGLMVRSIQLHLDHQVHQMDLPFQWILK